MTDAEGRITFYNEAAAALWGCRPEVGESKFCGSYKLYWPDGTPLPHDECPMAIALRRKQPIRGMEAIAERPDGTRVPFIPYPTPLFDATGTLTGAINMLVDIGDHKRAAEQALVERNILLALAGRAARVGNFAYDTDREILQISEDYAAIHGLPKGTAKITRSEWLAGVHPQDVERVELPRSKAFCEQRNEYSAEFRIIRPGGEVRWVEIRCFITYDGNGHPKRVVGVSTDVTDRKQAELALGERNTQLALAGKVALVGSYAYNVDAEEMQVSEGYAAIHDLPDGTAETTRSAWRTRVLPEDIGRVQRIRNQALRDRRREHNLEYRIVCPDRGLRWIESRSFISYDAAGHPQRVVGVNIDITERKRAEEARKILNAELDHRVKNALATVTAVISHTRPGTRSVADFAASLEGRIRSMAATHELLSSRHWQELSLIELIRCELAPYAARNNTEINGPPVLLKPEAGQAMAMVLHELATNAAKYGAFSTKKGRVSVRWDRRLKADPPSNLVLEWREVDGPHVNAHGKSSYGTSIIRDLIPYEFGGMVDLVFTPEGVRCRLELPANWLIHSNEGPASNVSHPSPAG